MASRQKHAENFMDVKQKVLIATDVPFWRRSTGAEQRIASLAHFMSNSGHDVRVFFLTTFELTPADKSAIETLGLAVDARSSDQIPEQPLNRIRWWLEATRHQYFPKKPKATAQQVHLSHTSPSKSPSTEASPIPSSSPPTTLEDYDWPWARRAFQEMVQAYQPDVILIEYVKLAYLIQSLNRQQRSRIRCAIDTHDVLHQRCESFRQQGCQHWIDIDRESESEQLNQFDVVIAIQNEEAEAFREMTSAPQVIVCPHVVYAGSEPLVRTESTLRALPAVGFLASNNDANAIAIDSFISKIWSPLYAATVSQSQTASNNQLPQLVIGGSVCESRLLEKYMGAGQGIHWIGRVGRLETFYDQIDLALNPVEFGSGLKIKSVEALAFGKPLLTTQHGATGLSEILSDGVIDQGSVGPVMIYQTASEFKELYQAFCDPKVMQSVSQAVAGVAKADLSEQALYSELNQVLFGKR